MKPGELGSGQAEAASGWVARVGSPRMLILVAAVLGLTNIPLAWYGSGGHAAYAWSSVGVLLALWRVWDHQWFAWVFLTVATAVTVLLYVLSIAGVIHTGLPGWWIPITGAADILALVIWLSPPIRGWVARRPAAAL